MWTISSTGRLHQLEPELPPYPPPPPSHTHSVLISTLVLALKPFPYSRFIDPIRRSRWRVLNFGKWVEGLWISYQVVELPWVFPRDAYLGRRFTSRNGYEEMTREWRFSRFSKLLLTYCYIVSNGFGPPRSQNVVLCTYEFSHSEVTLLK